MVRSRRAIGLLSWVMVAGCDSDPEEPELDSFPVPRIAYCESVVDWPEELEDRELELLEIINEYRSRGAECGDLRFPPSEPLYPSGRAACASRVHAADMAMQDFVDHTGSDDSSPWDRLRSAGSTFAVADEVLAAGTLTPQQLVDELWMPRPGSCAALMAPEYVQAGVGWASGGDDVTHEDYVVVMPERSRALPSTSTK